MNSEFKWKEPERESIRNRSITVLHPERQWYKVQQPEVWFCGGKCHFLPFSCVVASMRFEPPKEHWFSVAKKEVTFPPPLQHWTSSCAVPQLFALTTVGASVTEGQVLVGSRMQNRLNFPSSILAPPSLPLGSTQGLCTACPSTITLLIRRCTQCEEYWTQRDKLWVTEPEVKNKICGDCGREDPKDTLTGELWFGKDTQ